MCAKSDNVDDDEVVPSKQGKEFAKTINADIFFTSAKENTGVTQVFQRAAELCVQSMMQQAEMKMPGSASLVEQIEAFGDKDTDNSLMLSAHDRQSSKLVAKHHSSVYEPFDERRDQVPRDKKCC